jgi:hypothetical protein
MTLIPTAPGNQRPARIERRDPAGPVHGPDAVTTARSAK